MWALLEVACWASFAALVWTHFLYPLFIAAVARVRPRPVAKADVLPSVALIIPVHDEERVIAEKLENTLALDYPRDRLEILVASDASSDRTHEIVGSYADRGVRLLVCPRLGKVAVQDRAVAATNGEIVAFGDANVLWEADALRRLVRPFADPAVAMACGSVRLVRRSGGTNQEGLYWRYEMWVRRSESLAGSITGSQGAIYAVRRSGYLELPSGVGHDLVFPYRLVQEGSRVVYEPAARATEPMATEIGDEFRRKVRMFTQSWRVVARGGMWSLRRDGALYLVQLVSHRLLRYASGGLHVVWLVTSAALAGRGTPYLAMLVAQLAGIALALVSMLLGGRVRGIAVLHYYLLLTLATLIALGRFLRGDALVTWDKAAGTR